VSSPKKHLFLFFLYGWDPPTCSSLGCDNIVLDDIGYYAITVFGVFSCLPRQKQNN